MNNNIISMARKKAIALILAMTWAAIQAESWYITLSEGNYKLRPTKDVKYLIFNLPSIITCPFSTAMCRKKCYAKKSENGSRPSVLPSRKKNLRISKQKDFVNRMIYTIIGHCNRPSYQAAKTIIIRIHESGDFYSREYAKKWLQIARYFEGNDKIVFMCYTKSVEYFEGLQIPQNMVLRFSLWADTDPAQYEKAVKMGLPVYTAVDKFTTEKAVNRCLCNDCSHCQKCWHDIDMLICEIH